MMLPGLNASLILIPISSDYKQIMFSNFNVKVNKMESIW